MKADVVAENGKIHIRRQGYEYHANLPWSYSAEKHVQFSNELADKKPSLWDRFKAWLAEGDNDDWLDTGGWGP